MCGECLQQVTGAVHVNPVKCSLGISSYSTGTMYYRIGPTYEVFKCSVIVEVTRYKCNTAGGQVSGFCRIPDQGANLKSLLQETQA